MRKLLILLVLIAVNSGCTLLIPQSQVDVEITSAEISWTYDSFTAYIRVTNNSLATIPSMTIFLRIDFWMIESEEYFTVRYETYNIEPIPPGLSVVTSGSMVEYELNHDEIDETKTKVRVTSLLFL
jgi:hypothetical protein